MKKVFTVLALLVVLLAILFGVAQWLSSDSPSPGDGGQQPPSAAPEQPDWCPRVEVVSAPGTWESNPADDPLHPAANPASLLLNVTNPLTAEHPGNDVKVWTLPYPAQFRNLNALGEMSYDDSRNAGVDRLNAELQETHGQCPATDFVFVGFSQGAVIVGDIVSDIGNGRGVIPAERVRGAAVIADGRREPGRGIVPGTQVAGVGAEIALHPLNAIIQPIVPGATMRGTRAGGFGALNDKVMDLCAPDDAICDAPRDVRNALDRAQAMIDANGVHALYASNGAVVPGTTADQWVLGWARDLINS